MIGLSKILKVCLVVILVLFVLQAEGQEVNDAIMKARAHIASGNGGKASDILNSLLEMKPSGRLYCERAEAYISSGDLTAAVSDFGEANKLSEGSGDYGLARVYALRGDAATSTYHLSLHLASPWKKSEKDIMLDPAFRKIENSPEWRQLWKKNWYSHSENAVSEIEFLTGTGRLEEARIVIDELRQRYPESSELIYSEALLSLAEKKYDQAVISALKITGGKNPEGKYLRLLGEAQTGQRNFAGASVTYSRLLDSEDAAADILLKRAVSYRRTGETDKAIRDIEKYLGLYPEDRHALSLAGHVEAESGDNLKALEYFNLNVKLHPGSPECYTDRADSYFSSRSWDWAIKDYSMSLDLDPDNAEVWFNKGVALLENGKNSDACHDFRMAYSLGNQKASSYISKHCLKR